MNENDFLQDCHLAYNFICLCSSSAYAFSFNLPLTQLAVYFICGYCKFVHNMFLFIIVLPHEMDYNKFHPIENNKFWDWE